MTDKNLTLRLIEALDWLKMMESQSPLSKQDAPPAGDEQVILKKADVDEMVSALFRIISANYLIAKIVFDSNSKMQKLSGMSLIDTADTNKLMTELNVANKHMWSIGKKFGVLPNDEPA